jgi:hypothetical protein
MEPILEVKADCANSHIFLTVVQLRYAGNSSSASLVSSDDFNHQKPTARVSLL